MQNQDQDNLVMIVNSKFPDMRRCLNELEVY